MLLRKSHSQDMAINVEKNCINIGKARKQEAI